MKGIVMVEWVDTGSDAGWKDKRDRHTHHVIKCCSIGIVVAATDAEIVLIQSTSPAADDATLAIPKGCITRVRQLEVKRGSC